MPDTSAIRPAAERRVQGVEHRVAFRATRGDHGADVELPADDRGHRQQLVRGVGKHGQAATDDVADPLGEPEILRPRGRWSRRPSC